MQAPTTTDNVRTTKGGTGGDSFDLKPISSVAVTDKLGSTGGVGILTAARDRKNPEQQRVLNRIGREIYGSPDLKIPSYENQVRESIRKTLESIDKNQLSIYQGSAGTSSKNVLANNNLLRAFVNGATLVDIDSKKLIEQIEDLQDRILEIKPNERKETFANVVKSLNDAKALQSTFTDELNTLASRKIETPLYALDPITDKSNHAKRMTEHLNRLPKNLMTDMEANKNVEEMKNVKKWADGSFVGLNVLPGWGLVMQVTSENASGDQVVRNIAIDGKTTAAQSFIDAYDEEVGGKFTEALKNLFTPIPGTNRIRSNQEGVDYEINAGEVVPYNGDYVIKKSDGNVFTNLDYLNSLTDLNAATRKAAIDQAGANINKPYLFKTVGHIVGIVGAKEVR